MPYPEKQLSIYTRFQTLFFSFVEFNTEKEALDAYNNEEGYEMNGRWLVVDRIQPRSQMKAGNRSDGNDRSK